MPLRQHLSGNNLTIPVRFKTVVLLLILIYPAFALATPATVNGPNLADAASGSWTDAAEAAGASNDSCADGTAAGSSLSLTFPAFSIPSGSTVTGIEVSVDMAGTQAVTTQLTLEGTPTGASKSNTPGGSGSCDASVDSAMEPLAKAVTKGSILPFAPPHTFAEKDSRLFSSPRKFALVDELFAAESTDDQVSWLPLFEQDFRTRHLR